MFASLTGSLDSMISLLHLAYFTAKTQRREGFVFRSKILLFQLCFWLEYESLFGVGRKQSVRCAHMSVTGSMISLIRLA